MHTYSQVYEPVELEQSHLTDFDQEVRTTDMPERFQLRNIPVCPTEEGELEEESEWIYRQAFSTPPLSRFIERFNNFLVLNLLSQSIMFYFMETVHVKQAFLSVSLFQSKKCVSFLLCRLVYSLCPHLTALAFTDQMKDFV